MNARSFLDSNILVYTDDQDSPDKRTRAIDIVDRGALEGWAAVSTQVLQEYFVVTTRKLGVSARIAREKVEIFSRLNLVTNRSEDILAAIDIHRLHQVSFWDALIIRAAQQARCTVLLTEDLQHAGRLAGLDIVDPFR
jgi:predicted nucleic acid-binding protein